jgi:simple sugar transport system ATP-binding protein
VSDSGSAAPALELRGVTKRYGQVVALEDVSVSLARGQVLALLGENGAGKSTLMRVAYGLTPADAGDVFFAGRLSRPHSVPGAKAAGIGMVHQHLSLAPSLTASENLVLGGRGLLRARKAQSLLQETAQTAGFPPPADLPVRELSVVEQQRLEILKAIARNASVLIFDEPTALLAPSESDELLRWIRAFADSGGAAILVTHKLREALSIADSIAVLRRGRVVHTSIARGQSEAQLAAAMFPEATSTIATPPTATIGDTVVRAEAVSISDRYGRTRISDASFEIRRGEIVGVAAIEGSGHRELLEALAGLLGTRAGSLILPATTALIPADRARDALIPEFNLIENVTLRGLGVRRGRLNWRSLGDQAARLIESFSIQAASPSAAARSLSGGNQQRLVVARELEGSVDLVIADNPLRGLDMRASAFVLDQLREAANRGAAVVVHSTDVDEVLAIATRVLVVFHGAVRETSLDRDAIGRAMLGATASDAA